MPARDSDAVAAAVAATDQELFSNALGADGTVHDDTGDRSLEQQDDGLEGKVEDLSDDDGESEVSEEKADGEDKLEVEAKDGDDKGLKHDPKTGRFVAADKVEKAEGDEKPGAESAEAEPEKEKPGQVPPARLREESEKRRAVETENAALKTQIAEEKKEREALNSKFDLLLRQIELGKQSPKTEADAKADVEPDFFADPDGWKAWNRKQFDARVATAEEKALNRVTELEHRMIGQSFDAARSTNGEAFDTAFNSLLAGVKAGNPEALVTRQKVWGSMNPGAELMQWHRREELLREFGPDPATALQKKIEQAIAAKFDDPEFKKTTLDKWKTEAGGNNGNAAPRHVTRAPQKSIPSLNGASGSNQLKDTTFDDMSEESFFERALNPPAG